MTFWSKSPEHLWPSVDQRLLLDAALQSGDKATTAFDRWRSRIDLEAEFGSAAVRLLPLVYQNLRAHGVEDPLMGRLKGVYRRSWYETHRLFHQTEPVLARLVEKDIDVLLLKGTPLVTSYYRSHALRPMGDVDIAVRRDRVHEAIDVLREFGWQNTSPITEDRFRFHHALQFISPDGGEIDLHWHVLFEACSERADDTFWSSSEPIDFMNVPARQLDPTTLLLHVVIHGVRWNPETPVRWIPDALIILRTQGDTIDWDRLSMLAVEYQLTYRLALGFSYLRDHFQALIPQDTIMRLSRTRPTLLERIENTVLLSDYSPYGASAFGTQWVAFTEYCRMADWSNPLRFVDGYTHFLRHRLNLGGRREILPWILRAVGRRLQKAIHPRPLSDDTPRD